MNIADKLPLFNDDRAKAWELFTALCSVITYSAAYEKKKIDNKDYIKDLKRTAESFNELLLKNNIEAHFNMSLSDEDFERELLSEMQSVLKNKRRID